MKVSPTLARRFNAKLVLRDSGCIEWTGTVGNSGYGMISVAASTTRGTHVVAWFLKHGVWPSVCVLHRCDNRRCANIDHLFLGTRGDNNRDTAAKDRTLFGSAHHNAKLTESLVRKYRDERVAGRSLASLAADAGVSIAAIANATSGHTWRRA